MSLSPSQAAIEACGSIIAVAVVRRRVGLIQLDRRRGEGAGKIADRGIGRAAGGDADARGLGRRVFRRSEVERAFGL